MFDVDLFDIDLFIVLAILHQSINFCPGDLLTKLLGFHGLKTEWRLS